MFSTLYHALVYNPLYNGLVGLMDIFPWMDAGIAVIVFTIIVRLILFPLSKKAIVTQVRMKEIQPEIDKLKETMKNDREGQALKMMQLYKDKKVSPFSSILVLLIQLPIIFALYSIFINSGLPTVNTSLLYPFVSVPNVNMEFLGLIDISQRSILLAVLAAIAQFLQLHFSLAAAPSQNSGNPQVDMAQAMTKNMKYVFPVVVFLIAYKISAVVALYWIVTNLFTLGQELVVRRHLKLHQPL
jgi:YidC/Oxa1 family membrane protein insertase